MVRGHFFKGWTIKHHGNPNNSIPRPLIRTQDANPPPAPIEQPEPPWDHETNAAIHQGQNSSFYNTQHLQPQHPFAFLYARTPWHHVTPWTPQPNQSLPPSPISSVPFNPNGLSSPSEVYRPSSWRRNHLGSIPEEVDGGRPGNSMPLATEQARWNISIPTYHVIQQPSSPLAQVDLVLSPVSLPMTSLYNSPQSSLHPNHNPALESNSYWHPGVPLPWSISPAVLDAEPRCSKCHHKLGRDSTGAMKCPMRCPQD